jgi:hypothetical protein
MIGHLLGRRLYAEIGHELEVFKQEVDSGDIIGFIVQRNMILPTTQICLILAHQV